MSYADSLIARSLAESPEVAFEDWVKSLDKDKVHKSSLKWNPESERVIRELFQKAGFKTAVADLEIERFSFIQGALKNDEPRHASLVRAILADQPIPVLIATRIGDMVDTLDGHHRILATFQSLWPPYPKMRTILVSYADGRPFHWTDSDLGQDLKHSIPSFRS